MKKKRKNTYYKSNVISSFLGMLLDVAFAIFFIITNNIIWAILFLCLSLYTAFELGRIFERMQAFGSKRTEYIDALLSSIKLEKHLEDLEKEIVNKTSTEDIKDKNNEQAESERIENLQSEINQ